MATTPATRVTALARRYRIDTDTATFPASLYQQLIGVEDAKLIEERRVEDDEMYEDGGAMREAVTGYSWRLELKIAYSTNAAGTALDVVHAFLRTKFKATRNSSVAAGEFGVRFYERNGLDDGMSQEGRCYVKSWTPSGGKGRETIDLVLQGQGTLADIVNPNASLVPAITGLSPATGAAAGGNLVQIFGNHFTGTVGAAGVKFGANNATSYVVIHDGLIVAEAPAGVAGTVQVIVTNPGGVSPNVAADDYVYV